MMEEETLLQETPVDNAMESGDAVPMAAPTPEPQAVQQDGSIQYMTYREDLAAKTAAEELRARVAQRRLRDNAAVAPTQAEQPVAEQQDATATEVIGAAAADVGRGVTEIPRAVFGGIRDAAQETINLFGDIGNWVEENVKTGGIKISRRGVEVVSFEELQKLREQGKDLYTAVELPEIGDPESTTGKAVKGISQFLAGFGAAGKILKAVKPATRAGAAGKAAARGAVADFTVFDPQEDRLSNLLQEVPELQNPVTEFLAADPTDTNAEGRFKNAIEGLGLGIATDGFLLGLKTLRQARAAKRAQEQAAEIARQAKIAEVEAPATVSQKELSILGSDAPDAPLVGVAKARKPTKLEKAEAAVEGVTPTDIVDTAGAPRGTKDGEVFINFARINAAEDVQTVLQDMATRFKPDVEAAKRGKQTFQQIELNAEQVNAWEALQNRRRGAPLSAEESVAARQLWVMSGDKLAQVAKEAAANPSEANLFAFRKMLATHYAIQNEVLAARAETARALASWRIPTGGSAEQMRAITDAMKSHGGNNLNQEMADRVARLTNSGMYSELDEFVKGSTWVRTRDAMQEAWIMGLLSGPKTHLVNMMSNTSVIFAQMYERAVAARINKLIGVGPGVELGEATAQYFGMVQSMRDALRYSLKSFQTMQSGYGLGKIELPPDPGITSDAFNISSDSFLGRAVDGLGTIVRLPGRALAAEDEFFKTIGYRMELNAQALRQATSEMNAGIIQPEGLKDRIQDIISNPPENIRIAAVDAATYQTFTNTPGKVAQGLSQIIYDLPALKVLMPFVRTPANILRYTFERTPLAPLMSHVRADIAAGGARADLAYARMTTGSMLMLTAADMAMSGNVTGGGPSDPREKAALLRTGWQPYSFKIGDRWYAYNRLDPIGSLFGMSSDLVEILINSDTDDPNYDAEQASAAIVASLAANIMNKTWLSGIAEVAAVFSEPEIKAQSFLQRFTGSLIPAGVAEVARQVDPYNREVYSMLDSMKRRTPGLSDELPPRRDIWGRPIEFKSGIGWAYDAFSPIYSKKIKPEPIDKEMLRLEAPVGTPSRKVVFDGITVDLDRYPGVYSRYLELAGNELKHPAWGMGAKDFLNVVVTGKHPMSQIYQIRSDGPDGGKAAMIAKTVSEYRAMAREQLLREYPALRDEVKERKRERQQLKLPVMQ